MSQSRGCLQWCRTEYLDLERLLRSLVLQRCVTWVKANCKILQKSPGILFYFSLFTSLAPSADLCDCILLGSLSPMSKYSRLARFAVLCSQWHICEGFADRKAGGRGAFTVWLLCFAHELAAPSNIRRNSQCSSFFSLALKWTHLNHVGHAQRPPGMSWRRSLCSFSLLSSAWFLMMRRWAMGERFMSQWPASVI